jgi:phytoene dehydrogenase-like protein
MVGTPLTHTHFRRRHKGCYGVKESLNPFAADSNSTKAAMMQPQAVLAMKGLYCCGDNTFPFVGTPAVAASGMWVANTLAPVWKHWRAANVVDP